MGHGEAAQRAPGAMGHRGAINPLPPPVAPRREAPLGTTKEVLGFIIAFLDSNQDFLGFPIIVLGFPRIS